jgi:hypothetical protein
MEREAAIRITLNNGSFVSSMDGIVDKSKKVGSAIKANLSAAFKGVGGEGMKGASDSIKGMVGGMRDAVSTAATLGGGIGFGMLVKKASDLREKVRDIEFQINKTGKASADWRDILATVQSASDATGRSSQELADIYEGLFAATGDADFAKAAIEPIGHAATASGQDINKLADAAQMLQRKFGATAETLPGMLAAFVEKTDAGGLSLDALGNKFALMAGEAAEAGFSGTEGLNSLLGMMTMLDSRIGEKSEPAMKKLFQILKDGSKDLKAFSKESGLKFSPDMNAVEKLRKVLGSEKGRAKMAEKLGGDSRVVFDELSKPFDAAFSQAKSSGAKTKDATEEGLKAWDRAMAEMGKSTIDYARIVEESKQGQEEDPQAKLNKAIEKISQKFTEPKMLEALDQLSDALPKMANGMIKLLDFAVNHPVLAGGAFVAGKVATGAASGMAEQGVKNLAGMLKGALAEGGKSLVQDIKGTMAGGAPAWGKQMGAALGIAGAAIIAVEIGKAIIDARLDDKAKSQKESLAADIEATNAKNSKDPAAIAAARAKLEADYNRQREDYNGMGGVIDAPFNAMAKMVDGDYKAPEMTQMENTLKSIQELDAALKALTEKTTAAAKGSEEMAQGSKKAGAAAQQAAGSLNNIAGPTSDTTGQGASKGPGAPGNRNTPGYAGG